MAQVFNDDEWSYQDLLAHLMQNLSGSVERDLGGQLIIYTGLWEKDDWTVVDENPNEEE
jgi:hypothetical protein